MDELTIDALLHEARMFAQFENDHHEPTLFGVSDGKVIGTYLEQKFTNGLTKTYQFRAGNSASGIDLPSLNVDIKTTSIKQPQSSCPFRFARQKVYGLGYHLLVFVYEKSDDHRHRTSNLQMHRVLFVHQERTADYQTSRGIRDILDRDGNADDLIAFFFDRNLPIDDIGAQQLAEEIMSKPPEQGYLTISNALQWRLQYQRALTQAGNVPGLTRVM